MSEQSTAAPTTLRITFAGLCLLVQDGQPGKLHVLLPGGGGHAGYHGAQLYFDARHLLGESAPEGMCAFPLANVLVDLSSGSDTAVTHGASRVAHLGCITQKRVPRSFLDGNYPGELVKTRITLDAGAVADNNRGARWNLAKCAKVWMPTWLEWVIPGVPEEGITLTLAGLNGKLGAGDLQLRPVAREIHLFVFHSPYEHLPVVLPKRPLGEPVLMSKAVPGASHFTAFYPLVGEQEDAHPYPTLDGDGGIGALSREGHHEAHAHGAESERPEAHARANGVSRGFDYSCMLATALAQPLSQEG